MDLVCELVAARRRKSLWTAAAGRSVHVADGVMVYQVVWSTPYSWGGSEQLGLQ
ncbi:hypothetical protein [Actinomadura bangladeshensis]|uniref:hypothetical protein n=1 Tax=Actinomadura bangladeshensis TaxID=453573 RepID=UPI0031E450CB